jgi:hypothetical protein
MDTVFSMVCYTNLYKTEFGGRQNPLHRYLHGFESLLKIDAELVVYSHGKDIDRLWNIAKKYFRDNPKELDRIHIEDFDLKTSPLYEKIYNIRKDSCISSGTFRSYDVQYAKFITLNKTIETFKHPYTYYIDIGLSSSALFPNKYITEKTGMRQYSEVSLFNNKWLSNVNKLSSNGKVTVFKMDNSPEFHVESRIVRSKYLIIGGMFGGQTKQCKDFSNQVLASFHDYVDKNKKLPLEESVMTQVHHKNPENFNDITFQVWNHEDSGDVFKKMIRNKKMFYNTFEELQ